MNRAQAELPLKVVPGKRSDSRALAAKVFERHGIKLEENDASFAVVTLNELVLRKLMAELLEQVDQHNKAAFAAFQRIIQGLEGHASNVLARQVRDSANGLKDALRIENASARQDAQRMADNIRKTYRLAALVRSCVVGAVLAIVIFACGFWAGRL
jgi:septation ring formation regulator EzrA